MQVKTWNLSCVHRLPTASGPAWLKCVPAFMQPECLPIRAVATRHPDLTPDLIAARPDQTHGGV